MIDSFGSLGTRFSRHSAWLGKLGLLRDSSTRTSTQVTWRLSHSALELISHSIVLGQFGNISARTRVASALGHSDHSDTHPSRLIRSRTLEKSKWLETLLGLAIPAALGLTAAISSSTLLNFSKF